MAKDNVTDNDSSLHCGARPRGIFGPNQQDLRIALNLKVLGHFLISKFVLDG